MKFFGKKIIIFATSIVIIAVMVYGVWRFTAGKPAEKGLVFCTQEALLCPDGSYVSRIGTRCEFSVCSGNSFIGALRGNTGGDFTLILPAPQGFGGEVEYVLPLAFKNNNPPIGLVGQNVRLHGFFTEGIAFSVERAEQLSGKAADSTLGEIGVGKSVFVNGVLITLNKIMQDSRCPADVQCIQAGWVTANVSLRSDTDKETIDISLNAAPIAFDSFRVSVESVKPQRLSTAQIAPEDYLITFRVLSQ